MSANKVYEAIAHASRILSHEGIAKSRKNQAQGFNFRGIDDVLNALSGALAEAKLVIIPEIEQQSLDRYESEKSGRGGSYMQVTYVSQVVMKYHLISSEDGSCHTATIPAMAFDQSDKAINKALSAAYKYMAIQTFAIPVEGVDDGDAETPEPPASAKRPAPADDLEKLRDAIRGSGSMEDLKKAFEIAYRYANNRKLEDLRDEFKSLYDTRKAAFEEEVAA